MIRSDGRVETPLVASGFLRASKLEVDKIHESGGIGLRDLPIFVVVDRR